MSFAAGSLACGIRCIHIADTPQRIATDTSQKLDVRYGGTIAAYGAGAATLSIIPLAIAGWLRYVAGAATTAQAIGDDGQVQLIGHL